MSANLADGMMEGGQFKVHVTDEWVEWIEPFGDTNGHVYMRVTKQQAIAAMKKAHPGLTDEQALDEFIVVNWASLVKGV